MKKRIISVLLAGAMVFSMATIPRSEVSHRIRSNCASNVVQGTISISSSPK